MMATITKVTGTVRVKIGSDPVIKVRLAKGQYIVNLEVSSLGFDYYGQRKTKDVIWTAWVVTP